MSTLQIVLQGGPQDGRNLTVDSDCMAVKCPVIRDGKFREVEYRRTGRIKAGRVVFIPWGEDFAEA